MPRNQSQFARLVEFDKLIRTGEYPNCISFAKSYGVTPKTVQRDVNYLLDRLHAPIEYDKVERGYHYTDTHWFLPALSMSEGDLFALLVASKALEQYRGTPVAKTLERAFQRIAELLPDKLTIKPELIFSRFSFTSPPAKPVDEKIWTTVVRGLLRQRSVQIVYRMTKTARNKPRLIAPYHIANLQGEWCVVAHDNRIREIVRFAIADIDNAKLTDKCFQLPQDFDPEDFLAASFGRYARYGMVEEVKLRLDKEIVPFLLPNDWRPSEQAKSLRPITRHGHRPRAFAAKYMHFHCSIVPIFDNLADEFLQDDCRVPMEEIQLLEPHDTRYFNYVRRFYRLYRGLSEECENVTVKRVDHFINFVNELHEPTRGGAIQAILEACNGA